MAWWPGKPLVSPCAGSKGLAGLVDDVGRASRVGRLGHLPDGFFTRRQPRFFQSTRINLFHPSFTVCFKVLGGQAFQWPWQVFAMAILRAIHTPQILDYISLILGIGFVVAFVVA